MGALIGAVVYFAWGAASWMLLPWHEANMKRLPEETLIMDTLRVVAKEPGLYAFPCGRDARDGKEPKEDFAARHKKGPVGLLVYQPGGKDLPMASNFAASFVNSLATVLGLMALLSLSRGRVKGLMPRALLCAAAGAFVWIVAHVPYWNWFGFPAGYTLTLLGDLVAGFFLAGLAISRFVPGEP